MIKALASIFETARKRSDRSPRIPRAGKRGLGLADAMLAVIVLGVLGTTGWQIASDWIDRRLLANEGRALAELARAGRLWVEGDSDNRAPDENILGPVEHAELRGEGLWWHELPPGAVQQEIGTTPARRKMRLWLWGAPDTDSNTDAERILVIARARGDAPHANRYTPDAIDGVPGLGVVVDRAGVLHLAGPDVNFDMATINGIYPDDPDGKDFAEPGDLFALAHVFTSAAACPSPYLSREDPACATMATPLNMGGQALTGLTNLNGVTLEVGEITGAVTVPGTLRVTDDVVVEGNVAAEGNVTVDNDVTASNVRTNQIFANEGDFTRLTVDDLIANTCDGDGCP